MYRDEELEVGGRENVFHKSTGMREAPSQKPEPGHGLKTGRRRLGKRGGVSDGLGER